MKCRNCGHEIPNGKLHCGYCGKEVRIVPDYNPLDDVLTAQVKGSIYGTEAPLDDYEYGTDRLSDTRATTRKRQDTRSGAKRQDTRPPVKKNSAQARKQEERRRALKKKRRNRLLFIVAVCLLAIIGISVLLYQNSYSGQVRKGYRAMEEHNYTEAESYFKKAISKKSGKGEAYTGLAELYVSQNDKTAAEELFENAVEENPNSTDVYKACIQFYLDIKENNKIAVLLDNANDKIRKALADYIIDTPKFSLDDEKTYDDVQQLSLESDYTIYYTTDGTDPTVKSTKYTEPIQIPEEETVVKAIAANEDGIPSLVVTKTYLVELPIEDAPAVSPSTGQYDQATEISIIVPDGYTAYYTTDRTDPTENSTLYTGPISMPEGSTIFKAVLVNGKGKLSGITTRNYELILSE